MEMHSLTKLAFADELQKIASMHGEAISQEQMEALLKEAGAITSGGKKLLGILSGKGATVAEKAIPKATSAARSSAATAHKFAPRGGGGATQLVRSGVGRQSLQRAGSGAGVAKGTLGI